MDFLKFFYYIGNFHKILCNKKYVSRENLVCEILCSVQQTKKEKNGQGENKNGEGWNGTGWDFGPLCSTDWKTGGFTGTFIEGIFKTGAAEAGIYKRLTAGDVFSGGGECLYKM